jgi:hypothetical protein
VTVDNRGTLGNASDDVLLPGADYVVVNDDGDGVFDPAKDGRLLVAANNPSGIVVLENLPPAAYWVVQKSVPAGYDLAVAAPYRPDQATDLSQSCYDAGHLTCFADPAGGGMTTVFVVNSPLASASDASDYQNPLVVGLGILAVIVIAGGFGWMLLRR